MQLKLSNLKRAFGLYMCIYFLRLSTSVDSLFAGNPEHLVYSVLFIGIMGSVFLTVQKLPRVGAFMAALALQLLWQLSPMILNIGIGYFGFALLVFSVSKSHDEQSGHTELALAVIMSASYLYSALSKLVNPIWRNGEALSIIAGDPLFNWTFSEFLLNHEALARVLTWSIVLIETLYPVSLFLEPGVLRRALWWTMASVFVGIAFLFEFPFMMIGILLLHVCTYRHPMLLSFKMMRPMNRSPG